MSSFQLRRARVSGAILAVACALLIGGSTLAAPAAPVDQRAPAANVALPGTLPQDVTPNALPTYVAGTRWLVVNAWDATPLTESGGTTLITPKDGTITYTAASPAGSLHIPLNVPYGALLYQVDVYGYRETAGSLTWRLLDHDATTGNYTLLAPATTSGTGLHHRAAPMGGALVALGHTVSIDLYTTGATAGFVGAIVQYKLPVTNVLVPIKPVRVFDSRFASGGAAKIVRGTPKTISVKDSIKFSDGTVETANAIPAGATAVTYNLTITGTVNSGWAALLPGSSTTVSTSSINWSVTGTTIANGGVLQLGTGANERKITIVVGGGSASAAPSTHVVIDITGYYVSEG